MTTPTLVRVTAHFIVEFANQLRDQRMEFRAALLESADVRLRPIVMTGITTAAGSLPLLLSSGAGAETWVIIGTVVLAAVLTATLFTLFVVPVAYDLLARHTGSPEDVKRRLLDEQGRLECSMTTPDLEVYGHCPRLQTDPHEEHESR